MVWLDGDDARPGPRRSRSTASRAATSRRSACGCSPGATSATPTRAASPLVAVVNETLRARTARRRQPDRPAVPDRVVRVAASGRYEIVGLVADAKYRRLRDAARAGRLRPHGAARRPGIGGGVYLRARSACAAGVHAGACATRWRASPEPALRRPPARCPDPRRDAARARDGDALVALRPAGGAARRGRPARRGRLRASSGAGARSASVSRSAPAAARSSQLGVAGERRADRRRPRRSASSCRWRSTGAARALLFGLEPRDAGTIAAAVAALTLVALLASRSPRGAPRASIRCRP